MIINTSDIFQHEKAPWVGGFRGAELAKFVAVAKAVAKKTAPAAGPANHGGAR